MLCVIQADNSLLDSAVRCTILSMESMLISDFLVDNHAKLICVFEYLLPGIIWDEHNIVYMIKMKDCVCAYHYVHDDNEETREIFAINDFFHDRGIDIEETPINVTPSPFFSRILYPIDDIGKPFYVYKKIIIYWRKLWDCFAARKK